MSLRGLSCIFPVPDIKNTAQYYVSVLGFRAVEYLSCEQPHICLYRDNAEIILIKTDASVIPNRTYGYDAYIYTEAREALEKELVEKGVKFVRHLNVTDYQNKELVIEDTDGRWLAFGLKIKG